MADHAEMMQGRAEAAVFRNRHEFSGWKMAWSPAAPDVNAQRDYG
jgi:hypothetical protein